MQHTGRMEQAAHTASNSLPGARAEHEEPESPEDSDLHLDAAMSRIPIEIDVAIPIQGFRVARLLALAEGDVIESQWLEGEDLPLGARGTQLAWAEFEVIDEKLAVRITRLA
jgi:flagellar motor switch/type III secretory pathway protein FliN